MISLLQQASSFEVWEDDVLVYSDEMTKPKGPQLPAEVHNTQPIDSEKAWAATVALCKGTGA
jgi:hypothetical protein